MEQPTGERTVVRERTARSGRLRARAREQRGIAIIEAAFVTPIFFMLVLGIVEIGLAMNDYLAVSSAVRAGARTASASGNDTYSDYNTVKAVLREATALDQDNIEYIVIYKPTSFGEKPNATCQAGTSQADVCNVYTPTNWKKEKSDWGCSKPTISPDRHWCPKDREVRLTADGGADYVGVWMKVRHPWVTKMFGSQQTFTDSSVIRLEPRLK